MLGINKVPLSARRTTKVEPLQEKLPQQQSHDVQSEKAQDHEKKELLAQDKKTAHFVTLNSDAMGSSDTSPSLSTLTSLSEHSTTSPSTAVPSLHTFSPNYIVSPKVQDKRNLLIEISEVFGTDLTQVFENEPKEIRSFIERMLFSAQEDIPSQSNTPALTRETETTKIQHFSALMRHRIKTKSKECTRSGALALVAFLIHYCGTRILIDREGKINKRNLKIVLQLFFGKHPDIVSSCLKYADCFYVKQASRKDPQSGLMLASSDCFGRRYECRLNFKTFTDRSEPHPQLRTLIGPEYANQSFFMRTPRGKVLNFAVHYLQLEADSPEFAFLESIAAPKNISCIKVTLRHIHILCSKMTRRVFYKADLSHSKVTLEFPLETCNPDLVNKAKRSLFFKKSGSHADTAVSTTTTAATATPVALSTTATPIAATPVTPESIAALTATTSTEIKTDDSTTCTSGASQFTRFGVDLSKPVNFFKGKMKFAMGGLTRSFSFYCSAAIGLKAKNPVAQAAEEEQAYTMLKTIIDDRTPTVHASSTTATFTSSSIEDSATTHPSEDRPIVSIRYLRDYRFGKPDHEIYKNHNTRLKVAASRLTEEQRELAARVSLPKHADSDIPTIPAVTVFTVLGHVPSIMKERFLHPMRGRSKVPVIPTEERAPTELRVTLQAKFDRLPPATRAKYAKIFALWKYLYPRLDQTENVIPFATISLILQNVLGFDVLMGCRSAKDRTTAIICAINMLAPLFFAELEKDPEEQKFARFFTKKGRLNWSGLSVEEKCLVTSLFDQRLLVTGNELNIGATTNIGYDILKHFLEHAPFSETIRPKVDNTILHA